MSAIQQILLGGGAVAKTYATWNPADKNADITLSNGNLTANNPNNVWRSGRSTISKSSGKWYWEITMTANIEFFAGVANSSASLSTYIGGDINGWGYNKGAFKWNNNINAIYGTTFTTGDIVGVALNMDAGEVTMYVNGVSQGVMFNGITGSIFATTTVYNSTQTANFGATSFAYPVPSGYNAGLYIPAGVPRNGLVAEYLLATNSNDTSGNGYNGTDTAMSYSGTEATFNGTSSNISIASSTDFDFGAEYFISTWVNLPALPTIGNLFTIFFRLKLGASSGAQFEFVLYNNGGTQQLFVSQNTTFNAVNYTLPTNLFVNLCVGYTSGVITFYVNKVAIGTVAQATQCGTSLNKFAIGVQYDLPGRYLNGSMKKTRIYNRVLNAAEIAALYADS